MLVSVSALEEEEQKERLTFPPPIFADVVEREVGWICSRGKVLLYCLKAYAVVLSEVFLEGFVFGLSKKK